MFQKLTTLWERATCFATANYKGVQSYIDISGTNSLVQALAQRRVWGMSEDSVLLWTVIRAVM